MNFKQSTVFSIVASFGLIFINMLINVFESRVLGPKEIGRFQVYITTQTLFATFCALGVGQACIYFINSIKIEERKVLGTTVNAMIPIAILSSIVLFFTIFFRPNFFGSESINVIVVFCLGTFAQLLCNIFTPVLLTKMEVVRNQIVKYSTRLITLVVLVSLYAIYRDLTVGFLLVLSGVSNITSLLLLYYFFSNRFSISDGIDISLLKRIVTWGIKLAGNNIASIILSSIPVYFLTWFSVGDRLADVGYYSRANSLLVVGTVIASSIGPLLYSKWSLVKGDVLVSQVKRVSMLFIIINSIIALCLMVFAPIIISILYGQVYKNSIVVLQCLAISLIGNGAKEICYGILSSQGAPLKIMKNLIYGIVISAALNYLVIPIYGVVGCAIVTVIISIITALLLMYDVTKICRIKLSDYFVKPSKSEILDIINNIIKK